MSDKINITPIGGFPSIIPKELYNEIQEDIKRSKSSSNQKKSLSISDILADNSSNKSSFL